MSYRELRSFKKKKHGNDGGAIPMFFPPFNGHRIRYQREIFSSETLSMTIFNIIVLRPKLSTNAKCKLQNFTCCMLIMFDVQTLFELNRIFCALDQFIFRILRIAKYTYPT